MQVIFDFADLVHDEVFYLHLQIHYDRIGKDGLFSHKEITVIFVPDLSECLPSLDSWREQWLAHKKAVAERERQLSLRKEVRCFTVSYLQLPRFLYDLFQHIYT